MANVEPYQTYMYILQKTRFLG